MTSPTSTLGPDSEDSHCAFLASSRKHVLMITNHGVHQWQIIPGLPDTGGQNVFVNQFTDTMAKLGFRITIVNRGGYAHPVSGAWRRGVHYKDDHQRILYLEDGLPEFVRKEDMAGQIASLAESLKRSMDTKVDLIISHYWDGASLGARFNESLPEPVKHVWVPHSLGMVKKRNVSQDQWAGLRIDERITVERSLAEEVDAIAATSSKIRQALQEDYGYRGVILFLPPCVDTGRFHPREVPDADGVWNFLSQRSGLSVSAVRDCKIVTEISRTDTTKRKRVLIEAFARVRQRVPDSLLVVSIDAPRTGAESIVGPGAESIVDDSQERLAGELKRLIDALDLQNHVVVVGSVWEELPVIYAVTDVYCTPSVMEGFGMSAQEAAATGVPVVASHLVPFVTEYLLGTQAEDVHFGDCRRPLRVGAGAVVVLADDVDGFACALEMLLTDDDLRREMGRSAYRATIPRFTWRSVVTAFLDEIGIDPVHPEGNA